MGIARSKPKIVANSPFRFVFSRMENEKKTHPQICYFFPHFICLLYRGWVLRKRRRKRRISGAPGASSPLIASTGSPGTWRDAWHIRSLEESGKLHDGFLLALGTTPGESRRGGLLERSEEALVGYKRMIQDGVLKEKCKLCSRTFCGQEREKCEGRDFRRWK